MQGSNDAWHRDHTACIQARALRGVLAVRHAYLTAPPMQGPHEAMHHLQAACLNLHFSAVS